MKSLITFILFLSFSFGYEYICYGKIIKINNSAQITEICYRGNLLLLLKDNNNSNITNIGFICECKNNKIVR
jgi:hypothetical protein